MTDKSEKPAEVIEYVLIPRAVIDWLCCRGPDATGEWLGQGPSVGARNNYWWRTRLRDMLKDVPEAADMMHSVPRRDDDPFI